MTTLKIVISTLGAAILYGVIHDLITAHLCVEYFTIGHPRIINSESPVLLALTWGVIATWWLALPMGLLIAGVNHFGKKPSLEYKKVLKLIVRLMLVMSGIALFAGLMGYMFAELHIIHLDFELGDKIDSAKHSKFLAAGWAHTSSYLSGSIGSLIICRIITDKRNELLRK